MKNLISSFVGIFIAFRSPESTHFEQNEYKHHKTGGKDPVLRTLPLMYEYITQEVIDKAYRKAEQEQNRRIQRRSSAKLTPRILVCIEIYKALHKNISYNEALGRVWNQLKDEGIVEKKRPSAGSYCDARQRLPLQVYREIFNQIRKDNQDLISGRMSWMDYRIKTIDGVPLTVPAEEHLKEKFQVNSNQHGSAHWPKARCIWVQDVGTGCLIQQQLAKKGQGEESLGPYLLEKTINKLDLALGDAKYGTTSNLAVIQAEGGYFVCRKHSGLDVEKHTLRAHGSGEREVKIPITGHMKNKYRDLDLPDHLHLRAIKSNGDWFLTNLDRQKHPAEQIGDQLIPLRWGHEIMNREVKTHQQLEGLRSKLENTIKQEVYANLIVYNFIRRMMYLCTRPTDQQGQPEKQAPSKPEGTQKQDQEIQETPIRNGQENEEPKPLRAQVRQFSFTESLREVRHTNKKIAENPKRWEKYLTEMAGRIKRAVINKRPGRTEPRMVRPRKANYTEFLGSRSEWRKRNVPEDS